MNSSSTSRPNGSADSIRPIGLSERVEQLLAGKSEIKLLEAGCGSFSHISLKPFVRSVGIDISQEQLDLNTDLDEKILGDIQTYPLPESEFDVIVCWYVIEHLARPQDALERMFKALKPGGLLILTFPNILSIKGLVTKYTPHWFHRFVYRLLGFEMRPFTTYCRWSILPERVRQHGESRGLTMVHRRLMEDEVTQRFRERYWLMRMGFSVADVMARWVTFGKCPSTHLDNCELILKKNLQEPAGVA